MNKQMNAMRDKYWNECSQEEQINRLRSEVINLTSKVVHLTDSVVKLLIHTHDRMGLTVAPIDAMDDSGISYPPHSLRMGGEIKE